MPRWPTAEKRNCRAMSSTSLLQIRCSSWAISLMRQINGCERSGLAPSIIWTVANGHGLARSINWISQNTTPARALPEKTMFKRNKSKKFRCTRTMDRQRRILSRVDGAVRTTCKLLVTGVLACKDASSKKTQTWHVPRWKHQNYLLPPLERTSGHLPFLN